MHSLGDQAEFTAADVNGAALILTGLSLDLRSLEVSNRPGRAEPGAHVLLGKSYSDRARNGSDHLEMLADLANHPATARHICNKLVRHFISEEVNPDMLSGMIGRWQATGGNLTEVYRAMLEHPAAFAPEASKVMAPFEFVVSALRAFDVKGGEFDALVNADDDRDGDDVPPPDGKVPPRRKPGVARLLTLQSLRRMGQPVWEPPSPAGFPDDAASWLMPGHLAERVAWARMAVRLLASDVAPLALLDTVLADLASAQTRELVSAAPSKVHGLTMVLASPQFNRR